MVKINFNKKRYKLMFGIVIALIAYLAIQDIIGAKLWGTIGGWNGDPYLTAMPVYMVQFWSFSFMIGIVAAGVYYIFRNDLSEALAILVSYVVLILSGLEDLFYYIFKGIPLDESMSWLYDSPFMGTVAKVLGLDTVTPTSLIISIALGFIISLTVFNKFTGIRG